MKTVILICTYILFTNQLLFATNKIIFDKITVNNGLSHSDVNAIVQDKDGFVWFGTYNGLCRYDGNNIIIFRTDNSNLSNNRILSLYVSSDSLLYIGTEAGGLNIYDPETGNITVYKHRDGNNRTLAGDVVNNIFEDTDKNVWICTDNGVSSVIKNEKGISLKSFDPGEMNELILSGCQLNNNKLLLATNKGIMSFDKKKGIYTPILRNEVNQIVHTVARKSAESILIGSSNGMYEYNTSLNTIKLISAIDPLSIIVDSQQNIWVGTSNNGLYQFDSQMHYVRSFQADISTRYSIGGNEIRTLCEDTSGILWIGTISEGVSTINIRDKKIDLYSIELKRNNSVTQTKIITFFEDNNGLLWIGTRANGVEIMNLKTKEFINLANKKTNVRLKDVSAFYQDNSGAMWIGTWQGLFRIPAHQVKDIWNIPEINIENVDNILSHSNISIYRIVKDRDNHLWISTSNGVYEYIPSTDNYYAGYFVNYSYDPFNPNTIQDNFVTDIYADHETPKKTIWAGTRKGLSKITFENHKARIERIYPSTEKGMQGEFVSVIHQDAKKQLWIVTLGGGLNKMLTGRFENQPPTFEVYNNSKYPFPNNELESLLEDKAGNFWIGGYGITKFNPENGELKFYSIKDRLQSNSFKIWSAYNLRNGDMVFGGVNGFNIFHPDSIIDNPIPPNVILTGLKIFSKTVHPGDVIKGNVILSKPITKTRSIVLPYNSNSITIEFAALHFTSPTHNQYKYKLEGFDEEWHYTKGHETYGIYTNLKHGKYKFVVYGANSDGIWSSTPATLDIEITPPFWQTTLAYIVYAILFITALYLFRRSAIKKMEQKHNLEIERKLREEEQRSFDNKLKFFTDISHEIKTPLSLISVPIEDLLTTSNIGNTTRKKLTLVNHNISRLMKLVEQILDFRKYDSKMMKINVNEVNISLFIRELATLFKPIANNKKIDFICEFENENTTLFIDKDKMEKVIMNIFSNALKFTPQKGYIKLKCSEDDYFVYISIKDSGKGISKEELNKIFEPFYQTNDNQINGGTGIGLSLSKHIVDQHHGDIWAESEDNEGSIFYIKLRKGKEHFDNSEIVSGEDNNNDFPLCENTIMDDPDRDEENEVEYTEMSSGYDKSATILVAEDNKAFRQYIAQILEPNYNVILAENGLEAYEKAIAEQPDLIITDIMMPEMNGIELCDKIKNNLTTSHISVMMLTARDMLSYEIDGYETGADAYITKPFNLKLFRTRVDNLILSNQRMKNLFRTQIEIEPSEVAVSSYDQKLIKKCLEIIETNMSDPEFGVDQLCKEAGISRPQLYRKIKSLVGLSPIQFIRSIRLKRAAQILEQDNSSVSHVMYSIGINNLSYFSKIFKEEFGCLPKQYKKKDKDINING